MGAAPVSGLANIAAGPEISKLTGYFFIRIFLMCAEHKTQKAHQMNVKLLGGFISCPPVGNRFTTGHGGSEFVRLIASSSAETQAGICPGHATSQPDRPTVWWRLLVQTPLKSQRPCRQQTSSALPTNARRSGPVIKLLMPSTNN